MKTTAGCDEESVKARDPSRQRWQAITARRLAGGAMAKPPALPEPLRWRLDDALAEAAIDAGGDRQHVGVAVAGGRIVDDVEHAQSVAHALECAFER